MSVRRHRVFLHGGAVAGCPSVSLLLGRGLDGACRPALLAELGLGDGVGEAGGVLNAETEQVDEPVWVAVVRGFPTVRR